MKTILISLLFMYASVKGQTAGTDNWTSFNTPNYSILFPSAWSFDTTQKNMADLFIISPPASDTDKFRENVNIIIQDLRGMNINLDKYVEISEGQIKTLMTNGTILENKRVSYATGQFQKMIFTGLQGIYQLKIEQYYFVYKQKAIVVTFTGEQNVFDDYAVTAEKILNSFKLK